MSNINTNALNVNFPIPGINNNSKGFHDNFQSTKTNLDHAKAEITDIQSKAIFKSGLTGTSVDNNMANTLISNALVRGFRSTVFNLGPSVSGLVTIDMSKGDVQIGTITGDTEFTFCNWVPSGTYGTTQLQFNIAEPTAVLTFPATANTSTANTISLIENSSGNSITAPNGVTSLHFDISSSDCGDSYSVTPTNRNQRANQITSGAPTTSVGAIGDRKGTIMTDGTYLYVCSADYDGTTSIWKRLQLTSF